MSDVNPMSMDTAHTYTDKYKPVGVLYSIYSYLFYYFVMIGIEKKSNFFLFLLSHIWKKSQLYSLFLIREI